MAAIRKDREALAWFADELKAHRAARGWTQADVARETSYSESLIAQVETGHKSATPDLAKALDRVFATPGFTDPTDDGPGTPGTFGRLVRRLRKLPFPASFGTFEPREAEATALYTFEHSFIPGLLQTEEYARAVLEMFPDVTEDIVSERFAGRMSRQSILTREDPPPPVLCALIDESALNREIGGSKVMRDQLLYLAAISRRPNVTVQIIPNTGAHPGLLGAFTFADLGGPPAIVNIEDIADGRVTEDADTVSMVALRFHSLRGDALSKGASRDLMEGMADQRWKDSAP
ncbi:MAG TPA: helix-turn-helix transcriptional regulator [Trebonia sp.]